MLSRCGRHHARGVAAGCGGSGEAGQAQEEHGRLLPLLLDGRGGNRGKSLPKLLATACTKIPADVLAGKSAHRAADDRLGAVHVDGDPTDSPAHQDRAPCVPEGLDDPKHLPHGKPAK